MNARSHMVGLLLAAGFTLIPAAQSAQASVASAQVSVDLSSLGISYYWLENFEETPTTTITVWNTQVGAMGDSDTSSIYRGVCGDASCATLSAVAEASISASDVTTQMSTEDTGFINAHADWTALVTVEATGAGTLDLTLPYTVQVSAGVGDTARASLSSYYRDPPRAGDWMLDMQDLSFGYDEISGTPGGLINESGSLIHHFSWSSPGTHQIYWTVGQRVQGMAADVPAVPEPETWALLLAGLGMTGVAAKRRRAH